MRKDPRSLREMIDRRRLAPLRWVLGWFALTPVEILVLAAVSATVFWQALPRYKEWTFRQLVAEETGDVTQLNYALSGDTGLFVRCPARLDDCPDGSTTETCSLFSALSPEFRVASAWRKENGDYLGPAGGRYRYLPGECRLAPVGKESQEVKRRH